MNKKPEKPNQFKKAITAKINKEKTKFNKEARKKKAVANNYGCSLRFEYDEPISDEILPIIENGTSFTIVDRSLDTILDCVFEALY